MIRPGPRPAVPASPSSSTSVPTKAFARPKAAVWRPMGLDPMLDRERNVVEGVTRQAERPVLSRLPRPHFERHLLSAQYCLANTCVTTSARPGSRRWSAPAMTPWIRSGAHALLSPGSGQSTKRQKWPSNFVVIVAVGPARCFVMIRSASPCRGDSRSRRSSR